MGLAEKFGLDPRPLRLAEEDFKYGTQPSYKSSKATTAIRQFHTAGTRFFFVNQNGGPLQDLYVTVATLPRTDGVGVLTVKNVDEEATIVDICYRVKPDGSVIGWVGDENEHSIPIIPRFNAQGELESLKVEFSGGYVVDFKYVSIGTKVVAATILLRKWMPKNYSWSSWIDIIQASSIAMNMLTGNHVSAGLDVAGLFLREYFRQQERISD